MLPDVLLNLLQTLREPQVPGTECVHGQMNERMSLDADGMEHSRGSGDVDRGSSARFEERRAGSG